MIENQVLFLGDTFMPAPYEIGMEMDFPFILNLEAPITRKGKPTPNKINLVCRKNNLCDTFPRLPLAVCLANNHIMDFGDDGLTSTLNELEHLKIQFFGAGDSKNNFRNPLFIQSGSNTLALFGYCYNNHILELKRAGLESTPAPLDPVAIRQDIDRCKGKNIRIIVCLHWGMEENPIPGKEQVAMARHLIDSGAHCIIGHHAHVVQPVETYKNGIIAYGLGNFIFDDLDLPANYDETGQAMGHYQKRQRKWNKSSIGLMLNPATWNYQLMHFHFDRKRVRIKKTRGHRFADYVLPDNLDELDAISKRCHRNHKIINSLYRYLEKRKLPSIHGIRSWLGLVFAKADDPASGTQDSARAEVASVESCGTRRCNSIPKAGHNVADEVTSALPED